MPKAYLIAPSDAATRAAALSLGWLEIGPNHWQTPDGDPAQALDVLDLLASSLEGPAIVYATAGEVHPLVRLEIEARGFDFIEVPLPPEASALD